MNIQQLGETLMLPSFLVGCRAHGICMMPQVRRRVNSTIELIHDC